MTKSEVAEVLGISPRGVNRLAAAGRLTVTYTKQGKSTIAVYSPEESPALKDAPPPPLAKRGESQALTHRNHGGELGDLLERLLSNGVQPSSVSVGEKLLLTLGDAASLTSLSKQRLRDAIKAGTLKALFIGKGWKVRRLDLEDYLRVLFVDNGPVSGL